MDIRIDTKFLNHPKTMKLYRRLGADGIVCLLRLWTWAAENRPTGVLHGLDEEDIDLIAGGDQTRTGQTTFCSTAKELHWLDENEDGILHLHEWAQYNPWAADAPNRSDKARFSKLASVAPAAYIELAKKGRTSITAEEYREIVKGMQTQRQRPAVETFAPSPAPSSPPPPDTKRSESKELLRAYRGFPGYRAELEYKELAWLEGLLSRFPELDIPAELEKAKGWIALKEGFQVKNSRAYIIRWLERVQKERS